MKFKKVLIVSLLSLNIGLTAFSGNVFALSNESVKKDAYVQLAQILYNPKNNIQFQMEILERLAQINNIETNFSEKEHQYSILTLNNGLKSKNQNELSADYFLDELKKKDDSYFVYLLKTLLKSDELALRDFSAHILDNYEGNNDVSVFIEMLNSDIPKEREIAIKELADNKDIKVINVLLNYYKKAFLSEKSLISNSLSNIKDISIVDFFKNELKYQKEPQIIINSAVILVNNKQSQYMELINQYLFSKSIDESRYTALKLRDISEYIDLSVIESLSNSNDSTIRVGVLSYLDKNIANYLNKTSKERIIKVLNNLISDKANVISYSAMKILVEFPDKMINKEIKPLLYNKETLIPISNFILNSQNKFLLPSIKELTRFKDENIKFQSAKALDKFGKKPSGIYKELFLNALNPYIKLSAAIELYTITNDSFYLEKIIQNDNPEISNIAALYLYESDKTKIDKEKLKNILLIDQDELNKLSAALILMNNNDFTGINIIKNYLSTRKGVNVNAKYVNNSAFIDFLNDKDEWVQLNTAYNLFKAKNNKGIVKLKSLISTSKDERIRAYALLMIGLTGDVSDIDDIIQSYNDKFIKVKANAALAILNIIENNKD